MALLLAAVVAVGFTPTFFARSASVELGPLPFAVLVHGVLGTSWVLLFAVQAPLVAAARVAWHRRVGCVAAAAAVAFVASGAVVIVALEQSHGAEPPGWRAAHLFTNAAPLAAFVLLVAAGVWQRGHATRHKRLMLLAAVVLLPPALGRLFGRLDLAELNLAAYAGFAFANALYDRAVYGRPHPIALVGAAALVAIDVVTTMWLSAVGS